MNFNFRKQVKAYGSAGGTKDYVLTMYPNVPAVQEYRLKQAKGEVKAKTKQDYKTVLGTI